MMNRALMRGWSMSLRAFVLIGSLLVMGTASADPIAERYRSTAVGTAYGGGFAARSSGFDPDLLDAQGYLVGAEGFFNHWASDDWALQVDAYARRYGPAERYDASVVSSNQFSAAAHLAYRDPDRYALAAFASGQIVSESWQGGGPGDSTFVGLLGVEGQAYFGDVTLYGQAGVVFDPPYVAESGASWTDYGDFGFVRGVIRYFPTENLRLSAEALYARGTIDHYMFGVPPLLAVADAELMSGRVDVTWRPDDGTASYFAALEAGLHGQTLFDVTRETTQARVLVGASFDFGAETLKARDRKGVTFDLPHIADLLGQGGTISYCFDPDCPAL